jgi:hypothetical protein
MASRILRIVLLFLTTFLALTACAGGIGLIADLNAPPVEMLEGSLFRNYIVPGLELFVIVGGAASVAFRAAKPTAPRSTQATSA